MVELSCVAMSEIAPELALGIADASTRALALAHLQHCASCRVAIRELGAVVEELTGLVSAAEPPPGFESAVLASLAAARHDDAVHDAVLGDGPLGAPLDVGRRGDGPHGDGPAVRGRWRRQRALLSAAAVVAAVAVGAAGWALGSRGHSAPNSPAVVTASLKSGHRTVGEVELTTGARPWVSMAVDGISGQATVYCRLLRSTGAAVTLGSFSLTSGYGYWAARLPSGPGGVETAQLVGTGGTVVASARFTTT